MRGLLSLSVMVSGLAAFCTGAVVAPRGSYVVHEKRDSISSKWTDLGPVEPDHNLNVRIGLKQSNLHNAHKYMRDISHPESSNYGKHWTSEQVAQTFAPSKKTVDNVRNWLVDAGIDNSRIAQSDNKHWLGFASPASQIERVLHTKYHWYEDKLSGEQIVACKQYHVPGQVGEDIDYIVPGVIMKASLASKKNKRAVKRSAAPEAKANLPRNSSLKDCSNAITPECIMALYKVPSPPKTAHPNNSLGIFESGDNYSQEDLDLFFSRLSPGIPNGTHPIPNLIDGASGAVPADDVQAGEADMDFQLAYPLVYPQTLTLYQADDDNISQNSGMRRGIFNTFLDAIDGSYCQYCAYGECGNDPHVDPSYPDPAPEGGYNGTLMCGVYKPTNVISVSYGATEQDFPISYQKRQCDEFMKLGLQGVTILFASGDDGVAGTKGDPTENGCLGSKRNIFNPASPNTCPWLTNVGSTVIPTNHSITEQQPEIATERFGSGGGFSDIYPIPDYQAEAVATYFKDHNPPYAYYESKGNSSFGANGGIYNRLGRAYPDVAALGDRIVTFVQGSEAPSGGTSASTPIFAALINRINEERLNKGKGPVGFINPVLYKNPSVLNDVTVGSNPGCDTDGFSTAPGWDPVTGLGTPNYPKMLDLFLSLP